MEKLTINYIKDMIMSESQPVKIGVIVNKSAATKTTDYYIMPPLSRKTFCVRRPINMHNKKSNINYNNIGSIHHA